MNFRRARIRRTELSTQRRYETTDRAFALVELAPADGSPKRWLVIRKLTEGEYIISKHRKRGPAEQIVRRLAR